MRARTRVNVDVRRVNWGFGGYPFHAGNEITVLEPIPIHEPSSLMIGAGVNAKAPLTFIGHANISITPDRYGHLMPGNEEQAAPALAALGQRPTRSTAAPLPAVP